MASPSECWSATSTKRRRLTPAAGAALVVVAALLGAGQPQPLAQCVQQRRARVHDHPMRRPIHVYGNLYIHRVWSSLSSPHVHLGTASGASAVLLTQAWYPSVVAAVRATLRRLAGTRVSLTGIPDTSSAPAHKTVTMSWSPPRRSGVPCRQVVGSRSEEAVERSSPTDAPPGCLRDRPLPGALLPIVGQLQCFRQCIRHPSHSSLLSDCSSSHPSKTAGLNV
jgi:hypothetical protein